MGFIKVSVIVPTYNYSNYILDAIKSIEMQTYPSELIEVIIIDDGSTDGTEKVIASYDSSLTINYFYQKNTGKAAATQKGIELSKGDIIFNLDADDYFYPDKIQTIIDIYEDNPDAVFIGHPAMIIDEKNNSNSQEAMPHYLTDIFIDGKDLVTLFLENRLLYGGGSTFSAKLSILKKNTIPYDVDMYIDEFLIYAAAVHGKCYLSSKCLSVWRVHGYNYSVHKEDTLIRQKRESLLNSSLVMYNFISSSSFFGEKIQKLYYLKHLDRLYSTLEANNQKSSKRIIELLKTILSFEYSIKHLHTYKLFNRLLPTPIIRNLKSS